MYCCTKKGSLGIWEHSHVDSVGLGRRTHYCQLKLDICFNQTKGGASIPAASAAAAEGQPPPTQQPPTWLSAQKCFQIIAGRADHLHPRARECIISLMCWSKWVTNNVAGFVIPKCFLQHSEPYHSVKILQSTKDFIFPNNISFSQIKPT